MDEVHHQYSRRAVGISPFISRSEVVQYQITRAVQGFVGSCIYMGEWSFSQNPQWPGFHHTIAQSKPWYDPFSMLIWSHSYLMIFLAWSIKHLLPNPENTLSIFLCFNFNPTTIQPEKTLPIFRPPAVLDSKKPGLFRVKNVFHFKSDALKTKIHSSWALE